MRQTSVLFVTAALLAGVAANTAQAGLWCHSVMTDPTISQTIVCDDFDRYCVNPPAWPERCPNGSTPDQAAFLAAWPEVGNSGNPTRVHDEYKPTGDPYYAESWPFTARYYSGSNPDNGNFYLDTQHNRDLRPNIAALDPSKTIVNGTDENPLILYFVYHFHDQGRQYYQSQYVDLSLHDGTTLDRAPTDYVMSEDCSQIYGCGTSKGWPIVCQQTYGAAAGCPSLSVLPPHASIAVGIMAWLDTDPCNCYEGVAHVASNWHLVFFDGKRWWTLKSGMFPGGGTRVPVGGAPEPPPEECKIKSPGDFGLFNGRNIVRLTIKTATVKVEHWYRQMCKTDNTKKWDITHWAEIPRQYLGGFNNIALGVNKGCELNANGECIGPRHLLGPNGHGGNAEMDSVALYDGVLQSYTSVGACCQNDGTCVEADQDTCVNILQGRYSGPNTTCAATLCCPLPFADADNDGDVDQDDFGAFQVCYNGAGAVPTGCDCFDRNTDGKVDATDFNAFNNCFTGPNVPWSQTIAPICVP